jgi:hypothetical protein
MTVVKMLTSWLKAMSTLTEPADDKRCLDTLTLLDKTGFEASAIFTAKAGIIETNIDECLEWIITGPLEDK